MKKEKMKTLSELGEIIGGQKMLSDLQDLLLKLGDRQDLPPDIYRELVGFCEKKLKELDSNLLAQGVFNSFRSF